MADPNYGRNLSAAAKKLTERQRYFCHLYVLNGNATAAYAAAGFAGKDKESLSSGANILLRNKDIKAYVAEIAQARLDALDITSEKVLQEFGHLAFARITDVMSWDENGIQIIASEALSDRAKASIAEITETRAKGTITVTVKMHNKLTALQTLMKRYGLDSSLDAHIAEIRQKGFDIVDRREEFPDDQEPDNLGDVEESS